MATAEISLSSIESNFNQARLAAPNSQVMAVVKANAYGHGAIKVAQRLTTADAFAVARLDEAVQLREAGIQQPITLFGGICQASQAEVATDFDIDLVIHDQAQLELIKGYSLRIWLKLDTGMHRLGIEAASIPLFVNAIAESRLLGLMSHFSDADQPSHPKNAQQLETLLSVGETIGVPLSMANSAGILSFPESHLDWVRPGIMLFGANPLLDRTVDLSAAMRLTAPVIAVKNIRPGETIGYGSTWTASSPGRIGVIGLGYADGYPREIAKGTRVYLNGYEEEIVGRISMDMLSVSFSSEQTAQLGDMAELWGQRIPIESIAGQAETLSYTLMCNVSSRVPRSYTETSG
ncbi:MAG: alanine racemase [Gammaproteobacteria bacterium]|nr:alanine racemase [Gammaproteobacteria bacterium]